MLATQLPLQTVKRPMAKKDKKAKEGGEIAELKKKLNKLRKKLKLERAAPEAEEAPAAKASPKVSPLAPKDGFPAIPPISGVRLSAVAAGVKYKNRKDVMLAEIAPGSAIAGVFTRSSTRSAPVLDCEAKLAALKSGSDKGFAFIVNAGNSNAFTGHAGQQTVDQVTGDLAKLMNLPRGHVFSSSTGVIGEPLPHDRIIAKLVELNSGLSQDAIEAAAAAIMTVVFGSFLLEDDRIVKLFGTGLALAVLLDASLVRMLLVPATMELLGERNWWLPKWLDRILPTLNVEGPALEELAASGRPDDDGDESGDAEREPMLV